MDNPSWRMNFSLPIWVPLLILNMETGPGVWFAVEQVIYHSLEQPTKLLGIPQKGFSPAVGHILFLYAVVGERKQMRHPPQWSMPHYMLSFYKLRPRLILAPKGTMWCLSMVLNGRPIFSTEKRSGEMGSSHLLCRTHLLLKAPRAR